MDDKRLLDGLSTLEGLILPPTHPCARQDPRKAESIRRMASFGPAASHAPSLEGRPSDAQQRMQAGISALSGLRAAADGHLGPSSAVPGPGPTLAFFLQLPAPSPSQLVATTIPPQPLQHVNPLHDPHASLPSRSSLASEMALRASDRSVLKLRDNPTAILSPVQPNTAAMLDPSALRKIVLLLTFNSPAATLAALSKLHALALASHGRAALAALQPLPLVARVFSGAVAAGNHPTSERAAGVLLALLARAQLPLPQDVAGTLLIPGAVRLLGGDAASAAAASANITAAAAAAVATGVLSSSGLPLHLQLSTAPKPPAVMTPCQGAASAAPLSCRLAAARLLLHLATAATPPAVDAMPSSLCGTAAAAAAAATAARSPGPGALCDRLVAAGALEACAAALAASVVTAPELQLITLKLLAALTADVTGWPWEWSVVRAAAVDGCARHAVALMQLLEPSSGAAGAGVWDADSDDEMLGILGLPGAAELGMGSGFGRMSGGSMEAEAHAAARQVVVQLARGPLLVREALVRAGVLAPVVDAIMMWPPVPTHGSSMAAYLASRRSHVEGFGSSVSMGTAGGAGGAGPARWHFSLCLGVLMNLSSLPSVRAALASPGMAPLLAHLLHLMEQQTGEVGPGPAAAGSSRTYSGTFASGVAGAAPGVHLSLSGHGLGQGAAAAPDLQQGQGQGGVEQVRGPLLELLLNLSMDPHCHPALLAQQVEALLVRCIASWQQIRLGPGGSTGVATGGQPWRAAAALRGVAALSADPRFSVPRPAMQQALAAVGAVEVVALEVQRAVAGLPAPTAAAAYELSLTALCALMTGNTEIQRRVVAMPELLAALASALAHPAVVRSDGKLRATLAAWRLVTAPLAAPGADNATAEQLLIGLGHDPQRLDSACGGASVLVHQGAGDYGPPELRPPRRNYRQSVLLSAAEMFVGRLSNLDVPYSLDSSLNRRRSSECGPRPPPRVLEVGGVRSQKAATSMGNVGGPGTSSGAARDVGVDPSLWLRPLLPGTPLPSSGGAAGTETAPVRLPSGLMMPGSLEGGIASRRLGDRPSLGAVSDAGQGGGAAAAAAAAGPADAAVFSESDAALATSTYSRSMSKSGNRPSSGLSAGPSSLSPRGGRGSNQPPHRSVFVSPDSDDDVEDLISPTCAPASAAAAAATTASVPGPGAAGAAGSGAAADGRTRQDTRTVGSRSATYRPAATPPLSASSILAAGLSTTPDALLSSEFLGMPNLPGALLPPVVEDVSAVSTDEGPMRRSRSGCCLSSVPSATAGGSDRPGPLGNPAPRGPLRAVSGDALTALGDGRPRTFLSLAASRGPRPSSASCSSAAAAVPGLALARSGTRTSFSLGRSTTDESAGSGGGAIHGAVAASSSTTPSTAAAASSELAPPLFGLVTQLQALLSRPGCRAGSALVLVQLTRLDVVRRSAVMAAGWQQLMEAVTSSLPGGLERGEEGEGEDDDSDSGAPPRRMSTTLPSPGPPTDPRDQMALLEAMEVAAGSAGHGRAALTNSASVVSSLVELACGRGRLAESLLLPDEAAASQSHASGQPHLYHYHRSHLHPHHLHYRYHLGGSQQQHHLQQHATTHRHPGGPPPPPQHPSHPSPPGPQHHQPYLQGARTLAVRVLGQLVPQPKVIAYLQDNDRGAQLAEHQLAALAAAAEGSEPLASSLALASEPASSAASLLLGQAEVAQRQRNAAARLLRQLAEHVPAAQGFLVQPAVVGSVLDLMSQLWDTHSSMLAPTVAASVLPRFTTNPFGGLSRAVSRPRSQVAPAPQLSPLQSAASQPSPLQSQLSQLPPDAGASSVTASTNSLLDLQRAVTNAAFGSTFPNTSSSQAPTLNSQSQPSASSELTFPLGARTPEGRNAAPVLSTTSTTSTRSLARESSQPARRSMTSEGVVPGGVSFKEGSGGSAGPLTSPLVRSGGAGIGSPVVGGGGSGLRHMPESGPHGVPTRMSMHAAGVPEPAHWTTTPAQQALKALELYSEATSQATSAPSPNPFLRHSNTTGGFGPPRPSLGSVSFGSGNSISRAAAPGGVAPAPALSLAAAAGAGSVIVDAVSGDGVFKLAAAVAAAGESGGAFPSREDSFDLLHDIAPPPPPPPAAAPAAQAAPVVPAAAPPPGRQLPPRLPLQSPLSLQPSLKRSAMTQRQPLPPSPLAPNSSRGPTGTGSGSALGAGATGAGLMASGLGANGFGRLAVRSTGTGSGGLGKVTEVAFEMDGGGRLRRRSSGDAVGGDDGAGGGGGGGDSESDLEEYEELPTIHVPVARRGTRALTRPVASAPPSVAPGGVRSASAASAAECAASLAEMLQQLAEADVDAARTMATLPAVELFVDFLTATSGPLVLAVMGLLQLLAARQDAHETFWDCDVVAQLVAHLQVRSAAAVAAAAAAAAPAALPPAADAAGPAAAGPAVTAEQLQLRAAQVLEKLCADPDLHGRLAATELPAALMALVRRAVEGPGPATPLGLPHALLQAGSSNPPSYSGVGASSSSPPSPALVACVLSALAHLLDCADVRRQARERRFPLHLGMLACPGAGGSGGGMSFSGSAPSLWDRQVAMLATRCGEKLRDDLRVLRPQGTSISSSGTAPPHPGAPMRGSTVTGTGMTTGTGTGSV